MRVSIACLIVCTLTLLAARHATGWHVAGSVAPPIDLHWWGALSFALAAVIDPEG